MTADRRVNTELLGHNDLKGHGNCGQIAVEKVGNRYCAFVAHMEDQSFTVVDVTEPKRTEVLAQVQLPDSNTHSHKLRVWNRLLFVNNEQYKGRKPHQAGLRIFDISDPSEPREIGFFETGGRGVHRFWIDKERKLGYLTAGADGFVGEILRIVDLSDYKNPKELSRWWLTGQWSAGGEEPFWDLEKEKVTAHGPPIPVEGKLYLGYWDAGYVILDISSIKSPRLVARADYSPPYGGCTHTALPITREILGRKWLIVTDEAITPRCREGKKVAWVIDVTLDSNPIPVSTYQVPADGFCEQGGVFGPHNVHEDTNATNNTLYFTWYNAGLRIVDISNPYLPREVGYYIPKTPPGQESIQTNDLTVDDRGLIYLGDRISGGLDIVRYLPPH